MKLPSGVLSKIRGPILAVAVAGCSAQAAAPALTAEPEPGPEPEPTLAAAIDPVSYDPARESERYARLDHIQAADERLRESRIEDEEAAHRPAPPVGSIGPVRPPQRYDIMAACGRG